MARVPFVVDASAPELLRVAHAAYHALMSYAYGNAATESARTVADAIETALAKTEARVMAASPQLLQALREVAGDHIAIASGDQIPTCAFCSADEGADHEAECTMNVVLAAIDAAEGREPKAGYVVGEDAAVRS
jgi:hypothetical protein